MADVKITALTAISANPVNPATFPMPMVDLLDNTITASGTTKKVTVNQILGSGGTATLASATITGALAVDTTTLVANAAGYTDKVGIGTATPASRLDVTDAATPVILSLTLTGAQRWQQIIDTTLGDFTLRDQTGAINVLTAKAGTGNVNIVTGNVVMATSGKGIDFSAVTGGTGTATGNVLNDYEEGTFTATLKGGTTDPTIAVTTTGKYTKIGNQVFVRIMFGNVSTVGASGTISITGLPFTSATTPEQIGYLMVENMATFTNSSLSSYLPASSTTLSLYTSTSNSVITAITHYAGVARYLWTAITYTAA